MHNTHVSVCCVAACIQSKIQLKKHFIKDDLEWTQILSNDSNTVMDLSNLSQDEMIVRSS